MSQAGVVGKIKTHILYSINFYPKILRLRVNVEKYCGALEATDDKQANAHYTVDT
jgi:hypothetical protein